MKIYDEIEQWIDELKTIKYETKFNSKKVQYLDVIASFDIETSSFYNDEGDKCSIMYAFMIDVNHIIYFGRDWNDFKIAIIALQKTFNLSYTRRIIIWVHNLSYEFQFMSNQLDWHNVFALEERKVCYSVTDGIEFRCSYLLTGYSLSNVAEIEKLPIKKLTGALDYKLIRTPITPMTQLEIDYLTNDVEVVVYLIEKRKINEKWISEIPLTKTSYVRRLTKNNCNNWKYRNTMSNLKLRPEEYEYNKKAFSGGFTHGNMMLRGETLSNIASLDLTSDYPAQMVAEKYPMSKSFEIYEPSQDDIEDCIKYYCCIIEVEYFNIISNGLGDNILSKSKCKTKGKVVLDNGRILMADYVKTVFTEQDFNAVNDFYIFDDMKITKIIAYRKGYLPRDFIMTILQLYKTKTELKGVEERYQEYMTSKENLNSMYGMSVTDIVRDEISFNHKWQTEETDIEEEIEKYNKKWGRFLYYPWGIWVTAYARKVIYDTIKYIKNDYCYSDTDSVKIKNYEKYKDYFTEFNNNMKNKLITTAKSLSIDEAMLHPKTIYGEEKWLGFWEYEGTYDKFKTLGAKRYMTLEDGYISMTVSGLNKTQTLPYLLDIHNIKYDRIVKGQTTKFRLSNQLDYKKVFDYFSDGMFIPKGYTGKNIHTYIDEPRRGVVKDYLGNLYRYNEKTGIHLEESEYELSSPIEDMVSIAFKIREVNE